MNKHRRETVILSAWVDPALREYVRAEARTQNMAFSDYVAKALQRAIAEDSAHRAIAEAVARAECTTCGYAPCLCDQP